MQRMIRSTACTIAMFAVAAAGFVAAAAVADDTADSFRIEFNHSAGNDGEIVFRVTPPGGAPIEVRTEVEKGDGENHVAKMVTRSFKETLPDDVFHVERDDWEDVLVKGRIGTDDFSLVLVSSSVEKLEIDIEKE